MRALPLTLRPHFTFPDPLARFRRAVRGRLLLLRLRAARRRAALVADAVARFDERRPGGAPRVHPRDDPLAQAWRPRL